MKGHATPAELELYVLGALDASRVDAFEAHCAECDACAAALSGEASLELAFEQVQRVATRTRVTRLTQPLRAVAYGAAGLLAMAAATLLWVGHASLSPASPSAGDGTAAVGHAPMDDGAILDARNDALDGG
jgi:hypothetical protein